MKILLASIVVISLWTTSALAQSKETTGWFVSDIGMVAIDKIENRKPAKGTILEVTGTFQLVSSLTLKSDAKFNSGASRIAISDIKLTGYPDKGGKPWSAAPMAVGFNSPSGCLAYHFMDSKMEVSESQNLNGKTVEFNIKQGKLSLDPLERSPLCLGFVVPETSRKVVLTFSGTELSIENSGPGTPVHSRQTVFLDENTMSGRTLQRPSPVYPALARTARIEGTVVMSLTVAEDGKVIDAQVTRTDNPLLQSGVADTLMLWQFRPMVISNVPVRVRTTVTVRFP